jgi:hypothetical protein
MWAQSAKALTGPVRVEATVRQVVGVSLSLIELGMVTVLCGSPKALGFFKS